MSGAAIFASAAGDPLNPLTAHGRGLYAAKNKAAKCLAETDLDRWIMAAGRIINTVAPF
jgi:hypothetical protein